MRNLPLSLALCTVTPLLVTTGCFGDEHDEDGARFEEAYEEGLAESKADTYDCSGVRVPDRNGFNKRIALTFDDGPDAVTTPQVIQVLKRHRAPATFFINGRKVTSAATRTLAAQIAADPDYLLANHSQSHNDFSQISYQHAVSDIMSTDAVIRTAGATPRYFRFPYGKATCDTKRAAEARGYIVTGWHIDSADWCYAAGGGTCRPSTFRYVPDDMRSSMQAYVLSQVRQWNGGILLFHDVHQHTANALDGILTELTRQGYTFVGLDDRAAFPRLHGAPAPAQKFIGDACTSDAGCAFTVNNQTGRCHPAGFCTIRCEGSCPDLSGKAPTFCIADVRTANTGMCVSRAATQNQQCTGLPGTRATELDRFLGSSSASPARALVCAPR
jgi:peptidoglycan/xylan/chitin deacetylase (PgdA/CDA1 family)